MKEPLEYRISGSEFYSVVDVGKLNMKVWLVIIELELELELVTVNSWQRTEINVNT